MAKSRTPAGRFARRAQPISQPQCATRKDWKPESLGKLLDEVTAKHRVDKDRIYVTGLSMGGYGTWKLAAAYPDRFAAIIPICGGGDPKTAEKIKHLPIWVFHGAKDTYCLAKWSASKAPSM